MARVSSVQIGPFRYRVVYDQAELDRISHTQKIAHLMGWVDPSSQQIFIRPGMAAGAEADTLLHEILHVICESARVFASATVEEAAVSRITPGLLDVLRRNPNLLKALL